MKRRTVLTSLGVLTGGSLAGCLDGGNNNDDDGNQSESPPWLNRIVLDVDEEEGKGRIVARIAKNADVSELSLYKPDGNLQTTAVVGNDQHRVGLAQVEVSTMPVSFYGLDPGTYEISAVQGDQETERQPFDVVREFAAESISLATESSDGNEWVSGFESSVTNEGLYPFILDNFGPVDGVPNPPAEGEPGSAVPAVEGASEVVWWNSPKPFREDRGDAAGPLVVPEEDGASESAITDELTQERTATLAYVTTEATHELSVAYQLGGDLVTTPNGYAMSEGEIVSSDVESTPTTSE